MERQIIQILSASLTPLIAIITIYIAYQQYRTNRYKFRLDLYEKRFAIYKAIVRVLSQVLEKGKFELEWLPEFRDKTREAAFFFEKDITDYLDEIDSKCIDLWEKSESIKELPVGDERSKTVHEMADLTKWLIHQLPESKKKFMTYLKIEE